MTIFQSKGIMTIVALATLTAACAGGGSTVRPDEMSADAHRQEAVKVSGQAAAEANGTKAPPPNLAANPGGNPQGYYTPVNPQNPEVEQEARSQRLKAHARQHLNAARYLEASEDASCRSTPSAERAACPLLGPATTVEDTPGGVRVFFAENAPVDAILAHMRCHLAFARARGFAEATDCPLYVNGVDVARGPGARSIDIVSVGKNTKVADEIRLRAHEEVILVRAKTP
jgi:hypothetical protein